MTLAEFAGTAEMVVAGGVIASLPVVAWEIRKNTSQSKQANWGGIGRSFQCGIRSDRYLEQICTANPGLLVYARDELHAFEQMNSLFEEHIRFHLGFQGSREWWEEFHNERGFPKADTDAINRAIS